MIAGVLIPIGGDGEDNAIDKAVKLYQILHPETETGYLKKLAEVKLLADWKNNNH